MALDTAKLKARLAALKSSTNTSSNLWKPKPGKKYKIRIVPYKFDRENPFRELYFHYGIGKRSYLSPVTFGKPDPILEFAEKLRLTGDKEDFDIAKKLQPKMRTFVPIIVRGEEDQGVKFWGFGKLVYQRLITLCTDEDLGGDLSDPFKGNDLIVEYIDPKVSGKSFATTEIEVVKNSSPLTTDKDQLKHFIESQKDIFEVYKEVSYADLKVVLEKHINGEDVQDSKSGSDNSEASGPSAPDSSPDELAAAAEDVQPVQKKKPEVKKQEKKAPIKDEPAAADIEDEFKKIFDEIEKKA